MLNEIIKEIDEKQKEMQNVILYDCIKRIIEDKYAESDKNGAIELLCELRSYDRINDFTIPFSMLAVGISIFALTINTFSDIFSDNKYLLYIFWIIIVITIFVLLKKAFNDYNKNNKNLRYIKYIETIIKNRFEVK